MEWLILDDCSLSLLFPYYLQFYISLRKRLTVSVGLDRACYGNHPLNLSSLQYLQEVFFHMLHFHYGPAGGTAVYASAATISPHREASGFNMQLWQLDASAWVYHFFSLCHYQSWSRGHVSLQGGKKVNSSVS